MTIEAAKQIRIVDYLTSIGISAVKIKGVSYWYLSPFRQETSPSFKVNDYINDWYDFGIARGGDIIDLCRQLFNLPSVSAALDFLSGIDNVSGMRIRKQTEVYKSIQEKMRDVEIRPLGNVALLSYLDSRGIDLRIGRMYCREVHYRFSGKRYFAIAFQNRSGGYEIRNPHYKGCIFHKDISYIRDVVDMRQNGCCVFEGFMDFLSYLTIQKGSKECLINIAEPCDYLVLNSVCNINKSLSLLAAYSHIHCYLDNDAAGRKTTAIIMDTYEMQTSDESYRYISYKDLNDYLMERKQ